MNIWLHYNHFLLQYFGIYPVYCVIWRRIIIYHYIIILLYIKSHYFLSYYIVHHFFSDQRVPAEDLIKFVRQQAYWLVPSFFTSIVRGPDDLNRIASALSTSANLDVFSRTLNLDRPDAKKFQSALYAVRGEVIMITVYKAEDRKSTRLNSSHVKRSRMPSSAWKKKKEKK